MKSESTSRISIKDLLAWCSISSEKAKEFFIVNSLNLIEESLDTKDIASL